MISAVLQSPLHSVINLEVFLH